MTELEIKLIVDQNLSVFSVNSNINQNVPRYSFYTTFKKHNLQNNYLINSNLYTKLKRILPENEEIFKYQDLLFQIKNYYYNNKSFNINLCFKNNAIWVLDNIIILPRNIDTTYYYNKPLNITINNININNYLQFVFKIPFQIDDYTLIGDHKSSKEDLSFISRNYLYNLYPSNMTDIDLNGNVLQEFKKNDDTFTKIYTTGNVFNYKYNIKKVSIPNILSYVKIFFSSKINICMKKFQFCKDNLYLNIYDFKYVFIQFQCLEKIFYLMIKYLNLKNYGITLFEYCVCDKYLNLSINLNKKKYRQSIINYNTSYIKRIIDKYNIDLPDFDIISKKNDISYNNKTNNSMLLNIKKKCKYMGINIKMIKKKNENIYSNIRIYSYSQLILSIPIIKEVKGKDINININKNTQLLAM